MKVSTLKNVFCLRHFYVGTNTFEAYVRMVLKLGHFGK
jgi:hypothetical protein